MEQLLLLMEISVTATFNYAIEQKNTCEDFPWIAMESLPKSSEVKAYFYFI